MLFKRIQFFRSPDDAGGGSGGTDQEGFTDVQVYIDKIKEIRDNSVPKEQYEKLVQEKKELVKALAEGKQLEEDETQTRTSDEIIAAARKTLFDEVGKHTNLEMAQATLDLYNENLKKGINIFLPNSPSYRPKPEDLESVKRIAEALEHCVTYAEGDNENFNAEFTRILREPPIVAAANKNRRG